MITPVIQVPGQAQVEGPTKNLVLPTSFASKFIVGDTTPSVNNVNIWQCQNTSPLGITQFDNGQDGQTLYILGDDFTTVIQNANIKNASGSDTTLAAGAAYTYTRISGVWYQLQGTGGSSAYNGTGIKLVDWTFSAAPTVWHVANETWVKGMLQAVWFRGVYRKNAVADDFGVGIGIDINNMYALWHAGSSANVLLVKIVAGVQTTLQTIPLDNDTEPHEFELELITPGGTPQDNWISARVSRTNNPHASASYHDNALDLTIAGAGNFLALGTTDNIARGCHYYQLPATNSTNELCTVATGGTIIQIGNYRVHKFYASGSFVITQAGSGIINVFAVAGGGGGGSAEAGGGGGGITAAVITPAIGTTLVTVGAGGIADAGGVDSSFGAVIAHGGGPGGIYYGGASGAGTGIPGDTGGLPGGGNAAIGSGPDGASAGGGGGGSHAAGGPASVSSGSGFVANAGAGGDGYVNLFGFFGGGGAGGGAHTGAGTFVPLSGNATGGGGSGEGGIPGSGGGGGGSVEGGTAGSGGKGIIIVYYLYDPLKCG